MGASTVVGPLGARDRGAFQMQPHARFHSTVRRKRAVGAIGQPTGHLTLDEAERLEHELLGTKPRRRNRLTKSVRSDAA